MRFIRFIAFLLLALPAVAAERISLSITITNPPVTSNTLVINASTRTWTNASTASTIQTNLTSVNSAATNLFNQIAANPYSGPILLRWLNTNQIQLIGQLGGSLSASIGGTWATLSLSTQSGPSTFTAIWPMENMAGGDSNKTNQASSLVYGLGQYSTSAIPTSATALSNHVNLTGSQTISGSKVFTGSNAFTGSQWVSGHVTNTEIHLGKFMGTNHSLSFTNPGGGRTVYMRPDTNGFPSFYNRDGTAMDISDLVGFINPEHVLNFATALGVFPKAITNYSPGYSPLHTWNSFNTFLSSNQHFYGGFTASNAVTYNGVGINQTNRQWVSEDSAFTGTNVINGRLDLTSRANSALANGNNAGVVLGTNVYIRLSGPSGNYTINGFAAEQDGSWHIIEADNPTSSLTIANQSGTDPTAANRIVTGTGADVVITNNPALFEAIYNASAGRWRLKGVWR